MIASMEQNMGTTVSVEDMEAMSWALYRSGLQITGVEYSQVLAFWDQLAALTEVFFEEYDALILPATNGPAFKQDHFKQSTEFIEQLKNIDMCSKKEQQALIWEMFQYSLAYTPFTQQQNLTGYQLEHRFGQKKEQKYFSYRLQLCLKGREYFRQLF